MDISTPDGLFLSPDDEIDVTNQNEEKKEIELIQGNQIFSIWCYLVPYSNMTFFNPLSMCVRLWYVFFV